ncbi:hypothetical protein B0A52_05375 [Exophiala mesophila]|uniref:DNA polymerase delta subunit 4 n=1 Tax=Exophiala mesophila TaxID=212818 RepID=A0A438N4P5_EXOME|nr:hypothetical protein B0A52_05375 [Exophiala mesophila]
MPPRTRKSKPAGPTSHAQSRLSFNQNSARVTKANRQDDSKSRKASSKLSAPAQAIIDDEVAGEVEIIQPTEHEEEVQETTLVEPEVEQAEGRDVAIRETPRKKTKSITKVPVKDEREALAEKVTDAQIKKYWKAEEDGRLAPRVHQSHLSMHEKILRHFDLSSQYGPCIGIPRLHRWKRANLLGLEPPVEVLAVLLREEDKSTSQGCGKIAYIDELGGGKAILVE